MITLDFKLFLRKLFKFSLLGINYGSTKDKLKMKDCVKDLTLLAQSNRNPKATIKRSSIGSELHLTAGIEKKV